MGQQIIAAQYFQEFAMETLKALCFKCIIV